MRSVDRFSVIHNEEGQKQFFLFSSSRQACSTRGLLRWWNRTLNTCSGFTRNIEFLFRQEPGEPPWLIQPLHSKIMRPIDYTEKAESGSCAAINAILSSGLRAKGDLHVAQIVDPTIYLIVLKKSRWKVRGLLGAPGYQTTIFHFFDSSRKRTRPKHASGFFPESCRALTRQGRCFSQAH